MSERTTLQHRLNAARLNRFVGRGREIELFRDTLTDPDVAILYLHGPGGVGKSSLLDVFAHEAQQRSMPVVRVDARDIDLTPEALARAFEPVLHCTDDRLLLLLDTWERGVPADSWLRNSLLPELPADALVVISSRLPPDSGWTTDRDWSAFLRVAGVRNLLPSETEAFLRNQGIPDERWAAIAEMSYGHPLALGLLCVLERQQQTPAEGSVLREQPDLVRALLEQCIETIPRGDQRLALAICAHTRVTTEELLREVMELDDAGPMFDWLRGLSIMQEGPFGIFPHDLARDVIDADFRWRDRAGYQAMHDRVRAPIVRRIRSLHGIEQQQATYDLLFLHRSGPVMGKIHHWATLGQGRADSATDADLPVVLEMVERFEGNGSAAIARYWFERQPEAFAIFRGADNHVFGFSVYLLLTERNAEDVANDPAIAPMWDLVEARGPLRPGEVVLNGRFFMDRERYQANSHGANLMALGSALRWVTLANLGWTFMAPANRDQWHDVFCYLDHLPAPDADFEVDGTRFHAYAHDWRVMPADAWLALMGEREIASEAPEADAPSEIVTTQVLSRPDFEQAVRRALRDLYDPTALADNPLSRSRLVTDARSSELDSASALRDRLLSSIAVLERSPRDIKLYRAIDRTYLHPAASQELAAEALGLPFNTYRYHLSGGIRRIVDELWRIELGA